MDTEQYRFTRIAIGFCVATLYLVFITVVFGGFASYLSRVNLGRDLPPEVGGLDTLIFRAKREEELKSNLTAGNKKLADMRAAVRDLIAEEVKLRGRHDVE